ncbi:MAG TPA: mechanosensitive ion channel family protein [Verrucomicrobiae bacterium]|jgi:small-conductance mechanosensitive channel|nr:mechanosensitive ion channel family protein [Verrucomicrobiae bacterium]
MKTRTKIATVVLVVLLAATAFGLYRTAKPFVGIRAILAPLGMVQAQSMVDQSPLTTAQNLAQLFNSPAEQKLAQEALRLGDHEVDLTFAAALRDVTEHPPVLSAEAKKIQDRLTRYQKALDADNLQVAQLTETASKASGAKKDQLTNQLNLAKSQQELDQDEVDDAKQDLIRAGGDPEARILALEQEHEASSHNTAAITAAPAPATGSGLVSLYRQWLALHDKDLQLTVAKQAAESAVGSITILHNALESKVDVENTNPPSSAGASEAASNGATAAPTNQNVGDASDFVSTTKKRAGDRRALSTYGKRIDDEKQLAQVYDNWQLLVGAKQRAVIHRVLIDVAVILGILIFGLFFDDWFERLLGKTSLDRRQVETLRTVARVTLQVIAVLIVLLVIFGLPSQLGTFLGLAGAGLTVALKDFIVGFLGWFVLMGKNGIRLGDWVEINGVTGEVVELGMFHTVLLETGNWTDSGHPTGRRVTFTNSFAIEGHYFNFSTSGQWLWDELQVVLPAGRDPYPIVDAIQKKVLEATAETAKQAEKEWQGVARSSDKAHALTAAPAINVKPVVGGVEIAVRYITRANERYQLRAKLNQAAVDLLGQDSATPPALKPA